uniref:G-patch domain-containing protein n=1 Tax=Syphacia muris TaxID=451379 RepID=A0A0N5B0J8_9BILA
MDDKCNQIPSGSSNTDASGHTFLPGLSGTQPLPSNDQGDSNIFLAIIRNIPQRYHSKDLRYYFAEFVENGFFRCFHFRHRPEVQINNRRMQRNCNSSESTCCCLVSFDNTELRSKFKNTFHGQFWTDTDGNQLCSRCYVFNVKLDEAKTDGELLTRKDLSTMIEFRPPSLMPFGNVGTPSEYFLNQASIRLCKLPASLIGKLGLRPAKRIGKYGAKPWLSPKPCKVDNTDQHNYIDEEENGDNVGSSDESDDENNHKNNSDDNDDDSDECEEWDRHEALHDDVTEQDRTKPKKYEEELEIVWEKGGPGLVWYTDTFYWNQTEQGTDTDWKWADDWDVDYSVYYDKPGCSFDAKQALEIREYEKLRNGEVTKSVFQKKRESVRKRRYSDSASESQPFGYFEKYTKGIGSKWGWESGKGLGKHGTGKVNTASLEIEEAGSSQFSGQRSGFGYHGEKMVRSGFRKPEQHSIMTIYDIEKQKDFR